MASPVNGVTARQDCLPTDADTALAQNVSVIHNEAAQPSASVTDTVTSPVSSYPATKAESHLSSLNTMDIPDDEEPIKHHTPRAQTFTNLLSHVNQPRCLHHPSTWPCVPKTRPPWYSSGSTIHRLVADAQVALNLVGPNRIARIYPGRLDFKSQRSFLSQDVAQELGYRFEEKQSPREIFPTQNPTASYTSFGLFTPSHFVRDLGLIVHHYLTPESAETSELRLPSMFLAPPAQEMGGDDLDLQGPGFKCMHVGTHMIKRLIMHRFDFSQPLEPSLFLDDEIP